MRGHHKTLTGKMQLLLLVLLAVPLCARATPEITYTFPVYAQGQDSATARTTAVTQAQRTAAIAGIRAHTTRSYWPAATALAVDAGAATLVTRTAFAEERYSDTAYQAVVSVTLDKPGLITLLRDHAIPPARATARTAVVSVPETLADAITKAAADPLSGLPADIALTILPTRQDGALQLRVEPLSALTGGASGVLTLTTATTPPQTVADIYTRTDTLPIQAMALISDSLKQEEVLHTAPAPSGFGATITASLRVQGLTDWLRWKTRLESLPVIQSVSTKSITADSVNIHLTHTTDRQGLEAALRTIGLGLDENGGTFRLIAGIND